MRAIVVLLLFVWIGPVSSQDMSGKLAKQQSDTGNQKTKQRGTEQAPIYVRGEVTAKRDKREVEDDVTDRKEKAAVDKELVHYTGLSTLFAFLLFTATAIQICLFLWQLRLMREAVTDAKDVATAAKSQSDSLILAERAYVKMSHVSPGVRWVARNDELFQIEVEVKNHGRTPANVTDVMIGAKLLENGELLPDPFPYSASARESIPNAFLVTNETFFATRHFPLRGQNLADVRSGGKKLWIFGHVDYIDAFNFRHRSGYVRIYVPHIDDGKQNNLYYSTEARYNYDRQRVNGEGGDWG